MLLLVLILPFLGFLCGCLFGKFLGKSVPYINTMYIWVSFLLSFSIFCARLEKQSVQIVSIKAWICSDNLLINWSFCFDSLTLVMMVVVTFISFLVHLYSTEYMEYDPHLPRFMGYLSLFTFFMLLLVTANNFLQMFIGWEGVGVSSYLLINFWFTRIQANKAAIKAMLVNRVGDFFLLLGMFTIYYLFKTLDYDVVFGLIPTVCDDKLSIGSYDFRIMDLICLFLFLGAMGKSAQIGLHTWLPDAMEGPTPVSALIHAATMVTAGVFLLTRCSYFYEFCPAILSFILLIGSVTAFFAATTGLFQNDMKRVIAYSTCSQLGYMIFACGLSSYQVSMFHLSNHAFFKALLFLAAGSIIHAVSDEQDMRKMGGLKNLLPFTYSVILIGSLALSGFPFLAGFYSKDIILEIAGSGYFTLSQFSYVLGILAAFCTAFYSTKLFYLVFISSPSGSKSIILNAHEGSPRMMIPLFLLAIISVFIGFVSKELFIGFGTNFWNTSIFIYPENYFMLNIEFLHLSYKILPLIITLCGVAATFGIYYSKMPEYYAFKRSKAAKMIFNFFSKKWYFDRVYNQFFVQAILKKGYSFFYQDVDRGLLEKIGPFGIVGSFNKSSVYIKRYQTGYILDYIKEIIIGVILILFFLDIVN